MQGTSSNAKELDYYPPIKEIFQDLATQSNAAYPLPNIAWRKDFPLEDPLTDDEKEETF